MDGLLLIVEHHDPALAVALEALARRGGVPLRVVRHVPDAALSLVWERYDAVLAEAIGGGEDVGWIVRQVRAHPLNAGAVVAALIGFEGPEAHGPLRAAGVDEIQAMPRTAEGWTRLFEAVRRPSSELLARRLRWAHAGAAQAG